MANTVSPTGGDGAPVKHGDLHEHDMELVKSGGHDRDTIKALRERREKHFANDIDGPVRGGQISLCTRLAYAAPSFSTVPLTLVISVYGIQFYEKIGASLAFIAVFQALKGGLDVMSDPIMSYVTDSCRSKSGRRRPFLIYGCVPYAFCLLMLLFPPSALSDGDGSSLAMWFGVFYILFYLMQTITVIPYDAFGPEVTDDPVDRSKLFMFCTVFDGLGKEVRGKRREEEGGGEGGGYRRDRRNRRNRRVLLSGVLDPLSTYTHNHTHTATQHH